MIGNQEQQMSRISCFIFFRLAIICSVSSSSHLCLSAGSRYPSLRLGESARDSRGRYGARAWDDMVEQSSSVRIEGWAVGVQQYTNQSSTIMCLGADSSRIDLWMKESGLSTQNSPSLPSRSTKSLGSILSYSFFRQVRRCVVRQSSEYLYFWPRMMSSGICPTSTGEGSQLYPFVMKLKYADHVYSTCPLYWLPLWQRLLTSWNTCDPMSQSSASMSRIMSSSPQNCEMAMCRLQSELRWQGCVTRVTRPYSRGLSNRQATILSTVPSVELSSICTILKFVQFCRAIELYIRSMTLKLFLPTSTAQIGSWLPQRPIEYSLSQRQNSAYRSAMSSGLFISSYMKNPKLKCSSLTEPGDLSQGTSIFLGRQEGRMILSICLSYYWELLVSTSWALSSASWASRALMMVLGCSSMWGSIKK